MFHKFLTGSDSGDRYAAECSWAAARERKCRQLIHLLQRPNLLGGETAPGSFLPGARRQSAGERAVLLAQ